MRQSKLAVSMNAMAGAIIKLSLNVGSLQGISVAPTDNRSLYLAATNKEKAPSTLRVNGAYKSAGKYIICWPSYRSVLRSGS